MRWYLTIGHYLVDPGISSHENDESNLGDVDDDDSNNNINLSRHQTKKQKLTKAKNFNKNQFGRMNLSWQQPGNKKERKKKM